MAKIGILGSGAWGTALADLLANNGNEVVVFGIAKEEIDEINQNHTNFKYFPFNFSINNSVSATNDIDFAVDGAEIIVLAVPSFAIKETISKIKDKISGNTIIVNVAKGFDKKTKKPLGMIIKEELPEKKHPPLSLCTGCGACRKACPTHSLEEDFQKTTCLSYLVCQILLVIRPLTRNSQSSKTWKIPNKCFKSTCYIRINSPCSCSFHWENN